MNSHLSKLMLARFHGIRTSLSRSPAWLFVNCEVGLNRIRQEAGSPDGDADQCQKGPSAHTCSAGGHLPGGGTGLWGPRALEAWIPACLGQCAKKREPMNGDNSGEVLLGCGNLSQLPPFCIALKRNPFVG